MIDRDEFLEIEKKYYRGFALVDLDAVRTNFLNLKSFLPDDTKILAVVKADGYGHGAVPIARELLDICDGYAVATTEEGINLRKNGIDAPVYILGYVSTSEYENIINYDLIPPLFKECDIDAMEEKALSFNKKVPVSVAVDTGMGRIGLLPDEGGIEFIKKVSECSSLELQSVFTHFAKADSRDKTHAQKQLNKFKDFINKIGENGIYVPAYHCANSAAIMEMPESSMSIARAGIALYGLYPSDEMDKEKCSLHPAMSLYSHVVYTKTVPKGTGISYGHTFVSEKEMKVATIPLGYGDGYPRNLSGKGHVLIHGRKAKILGRVCMDQFMVDVTDIDEGEVDGSLVILVGSDGEEEILMDDLAQTAGTFNYEFACDINKRVPRVYLKEGKIIGSKDYFDDRF